MLENCVRIPAPLKAIGEFKIIDVDQISFDSYLSLGEYLRQAKDVINSNSIHVTKVEGSLDRVLLDIGTGNYNIDGDYVLTVGDSNVHYGNYTSTFGYNNIAGTKAFKIYDHNTSTKTIRLDSVKGIAIGMPYSTRLGGNWLNSGKILSIDVENKTITVDAMINKNISNASETSGYYLMFVDYPQLGTTNIGTYSSARGYQTWAGYWAFAEGCYSKAMGRYSHAEGYNTFSWYAAHGEGNSAKAIGNASHAEGTFTVSHGDSAHAEGHYGAAYGVGSHKEGNSTKIISTDPYQNISWDPEMTIIPKEVLVNKDVLLSFWEGSYTGSSEIATLMGKIARSFQIAYGSGSHAEGKDTLALNTASHAEGANTVAYGECSHAEGSSFKNSGGQIINNIARGNSSHVEGQGNIAIGNGSHAEGRLNSVSGDASHAEGVENTITSSVGHVEGYGSTVSGYVGHAEGIGTTASGEGAHAEGKNSTAQGEASHAEGNGSIASGIDSHAEGFETRAAGDRSHAEGARTQASGISSHAEGSDYDSVFTTASGKVSHAEGQGTRAIGEGAHAEGRLTQAKGALSHAEGKETIAEGSVSHAEGEKTVAGYISHAEGQETSASGIGAHAEGYKSSASKQYAHAEGQGSDASGIGAHAEGYYTHATENYSHAEGSQTNANAKSAHAEGYQTIASGEYQHVQGKWNVSDPNLAHIVGGGTSNNARKNIHTLDWNGNAWFSGNVSAPNIELIEQKVNSLNKFIEYLGLYTDLPEIRDDGNIILKDGSAAPLKEGYVVIVGSSEYILECTSDGVWKWEMLGQDLDIVSTRIKDLEDKMISLTKQVMGNPRIELISMVISIYSDDSEIARRKLTVENIPYKLSSFIIKFPDILSYLNDHFDIHFEITCVSTLCDKDLSIPAESIRSYINGYETNFDILPDNSVLHISKVFKASELKSLDQIRFEASISNNNELDDMSAALNIDFKHEPSIFCVSSSAEHACKFSDLELFEDFCNQKTVYERSSYGYENAIATSLDDDSRFFILTPGNVEISKLKIDGFYIKGDLFTGDVVDGGEGGEYYFSDRSDIVAINDVAPGYFTNTYSFDGLNGLTYFEFIVNEIGGDN